MNFIPIPGFPDYKISDEGIVLNRLGRVIGHKPNVPGGRRKVGLINGNVRKSFYVHSLVLIAFVGPRPDGMDACHNDGDLSNNRLTNLRWDTHQNNMLDKVKHGTHNNGSKTHCIRNHKLESPNLVTAQLRRGERSCKACATARITLKRWVKARHEGVEYNEENIQLLSDDYYSKSAVAC